MRKKEAATSLVRVALYIRVSGEEQKMHGLSLEAQQERLEKFARERGWLISGIYIDAAKTARKHLHKRTEFQRMIEAVKRNEVDILLFCRLDRWFRSVADYYKIMEILQAHNCEWLTTDEEYDTTTANGRLYINVKLSIAQNEADIDGERIDVVFDSKIAHGTVVSGNCPFGFRVNEEKRLEILRDPRTGAFGVMAVCGVLLLTCALWDTLLPGLDARSFGVVCLGFILSRALSGMAVATFPLAKESGLVHTFATGADKRGVALVDGGLAALAGLGMALLAPVPGCCALLGASLALLHYSLVCRDFGGTTGDLAGYFLTLCETGVLLGVTLGQAVSW